MLTKEQAYPIVKQMKDNGASIHDIAREMEKHGGVKCRGGVLKPSSLLSLASYGPGLTKSMYKKRTNVSTDFRPSAPSVSKAVEMLKSDLPDNVKIQAALHYLSKK